MLSRAVAGLDQAVGKRIDAVSEKQAADSEKQAADSEATHDRLDRLGDMLEELIFGPPRKPAGRRRRAADGLARGRPVRRWRAAVRLKPLAMGGEAALRREPDIGLRRKRDSEQKKENSPGAPSYRYRRQGAKRRQGKAEHQKEGGRGQGQGCEKQESGGGTKQECRLRQRR
jgi:hypothetical protein